jgi:general secretion pathway protein E
MDKLMRVSTLTPNTLSSRLDELMQQRLQRESRIDETMMDDETVRALGIDAGPNEYLAWLSARSAMPAANPSMWDPKHRDTQLIPFVEGVKRLCLALRPAEGVLQVVVSDPFAASTRLWLQQRLRAQGVRSTEWSVATTADVQAYYSRLEREVNALEATAAPTTSLEGEQSLEMASLTLSLASIGADDSPVVRFVNSTIYDALRAQASDIHLETVPRGLTVRYRLDGVLNTITHQDNIEVAHRVISRIKVLANLDIAERRTPQDGRLKIQVAGRNVDLRVSIMPSLHGEDAVLRILDRYQLADNGSLSIGHLGFAEQNQDFCRQMAQLPHGLFLVTGPTGSGKTTTLYGLISEFGTGMDKIVTIEDPVEYQLPGVLQIPVNESKGLTFARGLRSILRHDPDRIMVGEIRDPETAQIAIQAALTGHQVFATVHANNVFDVIGRMTSMGADLYNLVAALNGVLAQRLLRINCTYCLEPYSVSAQQEQHLGLAPRTMRLVRGKGCSHCRGTGFKGRRAIAQTMRLDPQLRTQIAARAGFDALREAALSRGMSTLRDAALDLAAQGITTIEEALRVTAAEE